MREIFIPIDFTDLRKVPLDIHEIENSVRDFYNCLDIDEKQDVKTQCLDARSFLDSARLLVRNLISIEENKYIKECEKAYFFMQENLGRVDKKINEIESENIDEVSSQEHLYRIKISDSPSLRRYVNSLITCMEHLVYYPLKFSLRKYNEINETLDGKKIIKNKDLFIYYLFLELLHSSESLGSLTAEKTRGKNQSISPNQVPDGILNYSPTIDKPTLIPKNVIVEEENDIEKTAEDFFSEPTDEEENEKLVFEDDDMEIVEEEEE